MIKFAHMSDCHLGSWNAHPDLRELPLKAFEKAIEKCIVERVEFILIAGDLFDTSMPSVDVLRFAAEQLRRCKEHGIAVYVVAGSHDFSPTGKTMLSVLESAGLLVNVNQKLVEHKIKHLEDSLRESSKIVKSVSQISHNTNIKPADATSHIIQIFGIEGLRGGLDKKSFEALQLPMMDKNSFRIFAFHSAIEGFCPPQMESIKAEMLPHGFDYYATGHLHELIDEIIDGRHIVFPGPLFPTNFPELEKFSTTGFYIVEAHKKGDDSLEGLEKSLRDLFIIKLKWHELNVSESILIFVDGSNKIPSQIENEFLDKIESMDVKTKIVLLKTSGRLSSGKPSDLNFKLIAERCALQGALSMKKSVHLTAEELELKAENKGMGVKEMEVAVIEKALEDKDKKAAEVDKELIVKLIDALKEERRDDEKNLVYDERIRSSVMKILGI